MSCFNPQPVWWGRDPSINGKRQIVFSLHQAEDPDSPPMTVPCRNCIGCAEDFTREWGIRCYHEAYMYGGRNSFVTPTYRTEWLPAGANVSKFDYDHFIRRIQAYCKTNGLPKIKHFGCAEYGPNGTFRPHMHIQLFNFWPTDAVMTDKKSKSGHAMYESAALNMLWPYGSIPLQQATYETARYVAEYMFNSKKNGYGPPTTRGDREMEFKKHSKCLGYSYLDKYFSDIYPHDVVSVRQGGTDIFNGSQKYLKLKPPRAYDRILADRNPEMYDAVKYNRQQNAKAAADNNTIDRLATREEIKINRYNMPEKRRA